MDTETLSLAEKRYREILSKSIIRNLATNVYLRDLDYVNYELCFNTLFHRTAYSYRCCTCAYEHEYLEYIQSDGSINEPLFEQVVANIINGECQHVGETPKEFLSETGVCGLHFAAACGTFEAFTQARRMTYNTRLLKANLWTIAVAKSNDCSMQIFLDATEHEFVYHNIASLCVTRSLKDPDTLSIREISLLEQCVLNGSIPLVKRLLSLDTGVPMGLESGLRIILENDLQDLLEIFIDYIHVCSEKGKMIHVISCAELAIVYDKPTLLEAILTSIPHGKCNFGFWLSEACDALQRNDCRKVLKKLNAYTACHRPVSERMAKFLQLLVDYHDVEKDKILAAFKADEECHSAFLKQYSGITSFSNIFRDSRKRRRDPRVIQALYDLGLDINAVDASKRTALTYFLNDISSNCLHYKRVRETLLVLIQENPDVELNDTVVCTGINLDMALAKKPFKDLEMKEYICDGTEHLLQDKNTFALNFMGPYLIECGFSTNMAIHLGANEELLLHPEEFAYLQRSFDVPRTLMLRCRDVLRKHFTGRKLRAFLDARQFPKRLEDFVLIKS